MRLLLDHCVDRRLAPLLTGHAATTAAEKGWDRLRNGELLARAAAEGFDALITVDQNLPFQQNLSRLPLAVVVLRVPSNEIDRLKDLVPSMLEAMLTLQPCTLIYVPV